MDTQKTDINTYILPRLASSLNAYLLPTVKCPQGFSEFQHKVGQLPIYIVFQRYLQLCSLKFMKKNLQLDKHVASAHKDYICDEDDEDMFCSNHK